MSDIVTQEHIDIIYERYANMLYRIALSHLHSQSDAEDIVHDVFYKYLQKEYHFKDMNHEKAWFIRVCVNCCYDNIRKNKQHEDYSDINLENYAAQEVIKDERYDEIMEVLDELDPKYKTVVILHYLEEMPINELAKTLNITVSAVKMRLKRARKMVQDRVIKG